MKQLLALLQGRWFNKDRFNTLVLLVLAYLGALGVLIDYMTDRAGDIEDLFKGQVTELTMTTASTLAVGQFTADYGWTQAFRLWLEMDTLGYLAAVAEDDALATQYDAVRDEVTTLSPVLRAPYFDPTVDDLPDIRRYEADLYISKLSREQQQLEFTRALANHWGEIDGDGALLSRILGTAILLLGFITALFESRRLRQVGLALVIVTGVYGTFRFLEIQNRIEPSLQAEAMDKVAEGVGLYYQFQYDDAIAAFDAALALEPDYTEAYVRRGFAHRDSYDESADATSLEAATADFERAVADGRSEVDVIGQLAELYYLQGNFTDAQRVSATGRETGDIIHSFDFGRSLLASGDINSAAEAYAEGIAAAQAQYTAATEDSLRPLSAWFWRSLDIAALELDALARCASAGVCEGAPPAATLGQGVAEAARAQAATLKSLATTLEVNKTTTLSSSTALVATPTFSVASDYALEANSFAYGVREVEVTLPYEQLPSDATMLVKVFIGDWEYLPLRHISPPLETTTGTYTFTLLPGVEFGEYSVQVFVDGTWVQEGRFEIVYSEDEE